MSRTDLGRVSEALHLIAELLAPVSTLRPSDTRLMPDYVLPAVSRCATDPEPLVRCALAARLGLLATTAQRTPLEGRPHETPPSVTAPRALLPQAQRFLETAQRCAQWRS